MLKSDIKNPRILSVLMLGFSSGLPLALTGSTLQAWFTESGVSLITIGVLSLIGMPYVWKFLWAPFLDRFVPPLLGKRRGWIFLTQIALCVALIIMARGNPQANPGWMGMLALIIASLSATQDIAIDAYRTDTLLPEERGVGMANFIFAYRLGMLFSGGIALVLADKLGWQMTYQLMAVVLLFFGVATWFTPEKKLPETIDVNLYNTIRDAFSSLLKRDAILLIFVFIILYKLGDALVVSLTSNFLLRGLGFSLTTVGLVYKTVGLVATILGAFLGGALLNRLGLYRGLFWFGIAQALSNLSYMFLALTGKNILMMIVAVFSENFCAGMSTIALLSLLTSLCDTRYSATQFACLSAIASVGRVFVGPFAAIMVEHLGWVGFYGWASLLCFPSVLLLSFLREKVKFNVEVLA